MIDAIATQMLVPLKNTFLNYDGHTPRWIVLHKTAGFTSAQDVALFFATVPDKRSAHYVVGQDGMIVQCVDEANGAGANCCLDTGAAFLPSAINLNLVTISIEHVDPSADNSTPLTAVQQAASFGLIARIAARNSIPLRAGDANGGIIGHNQIDSVNRARCPGNYPLPALWQFLQQQEAYSMQQIPSGWKDDGTVLTAPNGIAVVLGFREYILSHAWQSDNMPLEKETNVFPLEDSNRALGGGSRQTCRDCVLEYTSARGVFLGWIGQELLRVRFEYADALQQIQALQAELDAIRGVNVAQTVAAAIALLKTIA